MSDESSLNEGEIHDVLRNDRRRAVIDFLSEHGERATIRELSERIATAESGEDPPPRNVRQSVYVSLHQTHLPKLEDLGIVAYDTDSKDVELRERAARVRAYMGESDEEERAIPLAELCLVVGVLGVALSLVSILWGSIDGVGFELLALVLFAAVAGLGGAELWLRGER